MMDEEREWDDKILQIISALPLTLFLIFIVSFIWWALITIWEL